MLRQLEHIPQGLLDLPAEALEQALGAPTLIHLPGRREEEILFSAHCCHPSLANDNLSGLVVLRRLAELLSRVLGREFTPDAPSLRAQAKRELIQSVLADLPASAGVK